MHDALGREAQRYPDLARLERRVRTALVLLAEGVDDRSAVVLAGRLEDRLDEDVLVLVLGVGDEQRRPAGALDVLRPAPTLGRVEHHLVALEVGPDERRVDGAVLVERRDVAEVAALDELANRVDQSAAGHGATIRITAAPPPARAAPCDGRSASRARCSSSTAAPPRCSAAG